MVLLYHELAILFGQSRNIRAEGALHLSLIPRSFRIFIRLISIAVAICSQWNGHRRWSSAFCQCLCTVIIRMPATEYDYLWCKCLGIISAATGFPRLRYKKINPCADPDFPNTEKLLINCCFLCSSIRISSIVMLKSSAVYLASLGLSYLISIICEFHLYLEFRIVERNVHMYL